MDCDSFIKDGKYIRKLSNFNKHENNEGKDILIIYLYLLLSLFLIFY